MHPRTVLPLFKSDNLVITGVLLTDENGLPSSYLITCTYNVNDWLKVTDHNVHLVDADYGKLATGIVMDEGFPYRISSICTAKVQMIEKIFLDMGYYDRSFLSGDTLTHEILKRSHAQWLSCMSNKRTQEERDQLRKEANIDVIEKD